MVDKSLTFDLKRVMQDATHNFLYNMNRSGKFDLAEMDGTSKKYQIVICSSTPDTIDACLDTNSCLNNQCTIIDICDNGNVALAYNFTNNGMNISLPIDTIVWES